MKAITIARAGDLRMAYLHPELFMCEYMTGTISSGLRTHEMPLVRGLEFKNVGPSSRCIGNLSERGIALEHD
jgi:hypothetical protein